MKRRASLHKLVSTRTEFVNRVLRQDKSKRTLTGEAVTPEFFERSFLYEDLSDEESSKDVTDKNEDKTSEIKELTS